MTNPEIAQPPLTGARRPTKAIYMLLLADAFSAGMGQTIVFSVLPAIARDIGLTNLQTGLIFMISALWWTLTGRAWGRLSDLHGRKMFIVIGLIGSSVSMLTMAIAIRLWVMGLLTGLPLFLALVMTRSIYGLVGGAGRPAAQAYIADRTTANERTAGLAAFTAAFGIGSVIGPGFGAAMSALGKVAPFFAMAGLTVLMAGIVFALMPERTRPSGQRAPVATVRFLDTRLRHILIFSVLVGMSHAIPMQTIGFYYIDRLGFSVDTASQFIGVGLMAAAMAALVSQLVIVQRFKLGPRNLMRISPGLILAGNAIIWSSDLFAIVVFGQMITGFGIGLAFPSINAAASLSVAPNEQGAANGVVNSAAASGFIIAPAIAMSLYDLSPRAPYLLTCALAIIMAIVAFRSRTINAISTADHKIDDTVSTSNAEHG